MMNNFTTFWRNLFPDSLRNRIIVLACCVSLLTSVALGVLLVMRTTSISYELAVENVAHETQLVALDFKSAYNEIENDAFVISRTPPIQGILRSAAHNDIDPRDGSTTDQWRERLEAIFASVMNARTSYTQIRYIGVQNDGKELVRVNRHDDGFEMVPVSLLQAKSGESYFQKALTLAPGDAYFSKVTYNRELGKLDRELVPTLRVVVPIFDLDGAIFGMVVINADYAAMLRSRFEAINIARNIIVSNESGDYMEQRADGTVADFRYNTGGSSDPDALLATLRPEKERGSDSWVARSGDELVYSVRMPISERLDDSHLIMSIRVPDEELFAGARQIRNEGGLLALVLIALSLGAAAWAATELTGPLLRMTRSVREASRSGGIPDLPVERDDEIGELAVAFQSLAQNLTGSEAQIRAIFDNVVDGVFTIDETGAIQSYNSASERIFGFPFEDVMGRDVGVLMSDDIFTQYDSRLSEARKSGSEDTIGVTREVDGHRQDGSVFPMEVSVSKVDAGGQVVFVGIVRDITERKQMDTLKSEFVSTVNHELRTPLTSIQAALGILQRMLQGKVGPKEERLLNISLEGTQRLGLLVNDILDVEKIAAGKMEFYPETCEIVALVTDIVERHQSLAEKYHVAFRLDAKIPKEFCRVDPSRFNQALVNLLSNAAKFSPEGESVGIEIAEHEDHRIRISVSDCGPGIPASFRNKIFQRFAQADSSATRSTGGSGLGLNITKTIIETLDGEISFESVEGQGTTFSIVLPTCANAEKTGDTKWQAA
tara:strand:- start:1466 stop:3787 length:2322 start_codon:yes stop_codon:yes gene_type:complete